MSSSHQKLDSAVRAAVGNLAPSLTKDGYDRAMNYIGIWRALKSHNRRLYKRLESDAEAGGQEWRAHVDCLVEMVSRDVAPMARLIGREHHKAQWITGSANVVGRRTPETIQ